MVSCSMDVAGRLRAASAAVILPLLTACSGPPPETFDLSAVTTGRAARGSAAQIAIAEPTASSLLDSNRIVVRTGTEAVAYLTGAQWAERLPPLLQRRLIESFENARVLRGVGRPGMVASRSLQTEVRKFEADVTQGKAVIAMSVRLLDAGGRILASRVFTATTPFARDSGAIVSAALDASLKSVIGQIICWTARQV